MVHHRLQELPAEQVPVENEPGRNIQDSVKPGGVADPLDDDNKAQGGGFRGLPAYLIDIVTQDEDAVLQPPEGEPGRQRPVGRGIDARPDLETPMPSLLSRYVKLRAAISNLIFQ